MKNLCIIVVFIKYKASVFQYISCIFRINKVLLYAEFNFSIHLDSKRIRKSVERYKMYNICMACYFVIIQLTADETLIYMTYFLRTYIWLVTRETHTYFLGSNGITLQNYKIIYMFMFVPFFIMIIHKPRKQRTL